MNQNFSEFSEFSESDKSLKEELGSIQRFSLLPCLAGAVIASQFLTYEVVGSNNLFEKK